MGKKPYIDAYKKDKERYELEKSRLKEAFPKKKKRKTPESENLPKGPKKPLSPFFHYQADRRSQLKVEKPELNNKEIVSLMSQEW